MKIYNKIVINMNKIYIDKTIFKDDFDVKKYYKVNKIAYRIFHSPKGFMHMRVNNNKGIKNITYQQEVVSTYFNSKTSNVLELGCGQSANIKYLAKKYPKINFTGIDIYPGKCKLKNTKILTMDYHNLSIFEENSFDIVYAIATLCYSQDKNKIYKEVFRILKPNGYFIIFDAYANVERENIGENDKKIMSLIEKGMAVKKFESYKNIATYAKNSGFKIIKQENLSNNILNNARYFKILSSLVVKVKPTSYLIFKLFPKEFTGNIVSGYYMEYALKNKLYIYMLDIYQK